MLSKLQLRVDPQTAAEQVRLQIEISNQLGIDVNRIKRIDIIKRSIDARQRRVMVNMTVNAHIDEVEPDVDIAQPVEYKELDDNAPSAVIVGAGPAGLFAALRLIELGFRPIVVERGKDVDSRLRDCAMISREGTVLPDSNYCFGEGGAGAYSDGKLYTRSKKRGSVEKILNIFHQHGASRDILVDAHPHIGTDRLPGVIKAMRKTIERCGGIVMFNTRMDSLIVKSDKNGRYVSGIVCSDGKEVNGPVILATGHSARDVYHNLVNNDIPVEAKGIAVGVRLEHPQELIDRIQYHSPKGRGQWLPAAEYTMLTRVDGRAVYSFCMCPGGFIIPAASSSGQMVVNGMSPANRGTRWANSGMVVEVLPEDIPGNDPLRMMEFQESIENRFYNDGDGSQNAPAQCMEDFVNSCLSKTIPPTSYAPGVHSARIDKLLPPEVATRLQKGFVEFGRKSRGFLTNQAVLIGDETRTSSPVRVPRNPDTLEHVAVRGLYPCGEGAGYAGGIVSAAIDGERCADALAATRL